MKENNEYFTTPYKVEGIILLAIPILIALFFLIVISIVIVMMYIDRRRIGRMEEWEELPEEN